MRATRAQLEARDSTIAWLNQRQAERDQAINDLILLNTAHRQLEAKIMLAAQIPTDADKESWPARIREMRAKCDQCDSLRAENERLRESQDERDSILRRLIAAYRSASGYDLLDEAIAPLVEESTRILGA